LDMEEKYCVSSFVIDRWVRELCISRKINCNQEAVEMMVFNNFTIKQMAKQLRCAIPTITKYLKKYNL